MHIASLVQGHMRMMKAASSGDELDGWYGILVLFLMKLTAAGCRSGMYALHMCRQKSDFAHLISLPKQHAV